MLTYGFFNSVNGDRTYNAETISNMFKGLISDGVYKSVGDAFVVSPSSGLTLSVGSGRAIVSERWVENDAAVTITLNAAHVTLNRYTAIVLRRDLTNRQVTLQMIDGTPATNPAKPSIVRTDTLYDICLAYVYVGAGATTITASNISDARANTDVCGYVHMLLSTYLQRFYADYSVTSNGTNYIDLPSALDYEYGDLLDVYVDGLFLSPSEYTIMENEVENIPMINITNDLDSGSTVTFINTKSIILGDSDISPIVDVINGEVI